MGVVKQKKDRFYVKIGSDLDRFEPLYTGLGCFGIVVASFWTFRNVFGHYPANPATSNYLAVRN